MNLPGNKKSILIFTSILMVLLLIPVCSGAVFLRDGTDISRDAIGDRIHSSLYGSPSPFPIEFFYSTGCGSCRDAREFFQSYQRKHPSVQVAFRNLVLNENKELFNTYKNQFRYEKISYPAVFIGDIGITGSSDIIHATDVVVNGYQNR